MKVKRTQEGRFSLRGRIPWNQAPPGRGQGSGTEEIPDNDIIASQGNLAPMKRITRVKDDLWHSRGTRLSTECL